jgi:hypothetical protein
MSLNYGLGMGGGGQQQQMMMSSSISAVSLSVALAGLGLAGWQMGWFGGSSEPEPEPVTSTLPEEGAQPVTQNLDGARLITNGIYSMRVQGSSCGNQQVVFSKADGTKWAWNLKNVGTIDIDAQKGVPVYTIESTYKVSRQACDKRYLTAPDGCRGSPYLDRFRAMDYSQRWILVQNSQGMYEIRSLLCAKNQQRSQYIVQSGANNNSKPGFSAGSGTPFELNSVVL